MFPKIKEYIKTNKKELSGNELYEYLDELQNSKFTTDPQKVKEIDKLDQLDI